MKRTLCIILTAAMLLTVCSALNVSAATSKLTNIAKGCSYEYSEPYTTDPSGAAYRQVDGKELTDGIMGTSSWGTEWIGWYYKDVAEHYATVDLGKKVSGIVKISLNFAVNSWGVAYPGYVKFYISDDGKNFTELGSKTTSSVNSITNISVRIPEGTSGRYVKAVVGKGNSIFVFCSEFMVYTGTLGDDDDDDDDYVDVEYNPSTGNPADPNARVVASAPDYSTVRVMYNSGEYIENSSSYGFKKQKLVRGVCSDVSVSDFMQTLGTASSYVTDGDGKKKTDSLVATGDVAVSGSDKAIIIIDGDVDCDSAVTAVDYTCAKRFMSGTKSDLSSASKAAADIDGNGSIDASDCGAIKAHVICKSDLFEKYSDSDRIEKCEMTYSFDSASQFSVTADNTSVGKVKLTFDHKTWGTWNIGTWSVDGTRVAGGGTDWEYVFRAGESASSITFQGGNHGSENLISLNIFDNATGKELSQKVGTTEKINGLKIVEKTNIVYEGNGKPFMAVTRTYYIIGERITLECEYELLSATYFNTSYTGMFPVPKTQGLYITFHKTDGSDLDYTSLKVGASDYSGPFYGQTNASSVTISGYSGKAIKFDVTSYGEDASHNFDSDLKTFYWDMNSGENKLYFAIFGAGARQRQVKEGVRWSTKTTWKMSPNK